jgi:SAM-dependent methyltransferase
MQDKQGGVLLERGHPPRNYEERRFGRSRRGRRMNRFERETARSVLSTLPSNSLVLDIPCGTGRFKDMIIEQGHRYVGMDLNFEAAQCSLQRLETAWPTVQASIFNLPLASNSVDFILSVRMLHHLKGEEVLRVLKEISRVAPQALVTFYNRWTWRVQRRRFSPRIRRREWRGGERWDERTYSVREMAAWARQAGLRIKEKIPRRSFFTTNQFLWLERV